MVSTKFILSSVVALAALAAATPVANPEPIPAAKAAPQSLSPRAMNQGFIMSRSYFESLKARANGEDIASIEKRGNNAPNSQGCTSNAGCASDYPGYPFCICADQVYGYNGSPSYEVYMCSNENCDACVPDDC